ncbi:MAG: hypothetical protein ACK5P7_12510 [Bdellovibrio sp.]|jgi:hypothetical protein
MRFVYVLEDDVKFMHEITAALMAVDPLLQVRQFKNLAAFAEWIKQVVAEGAAAIKKGGVAPDGFKFEEVSESQECILQVVISKVEILGPRQLGLIKKTRDLFTKYKICSAEDPTAFVLTAFEDPAFKITELRDRILSNILMKPFDKLILQQHLTFALDGRHPPSKHAVAPYKTKAIIEVLKVVDMEILSLIGFRSVADREIPVGSVAKYYGKVFTSDRQRSVIAKVIECRPHPAKPEEFQVTTSFFGLDPTQISNLRRHVLEQKDKYVDSSLSVRPLKTKQSVGIVFVEDRDEVFQPLESTLKRKIKGARIVRYRSLKEILVEVDPKLDQSGPVAKPFGDSASALVEVDLRGKIIKLPAAGLSFAGLAWSMGTLLVACLRESERKSFADWLLKPEGNFFSSMGVGEQSYVMKITLVQGREFKLEEASAIERADYHRKNSQIAKGIDFMFISNRFAGPDRLDLWTEVLARLKVMTRSDQIRTTVLSAQDFTDEEERQMARVFDDLSYVPVERVYVMQKMLLMNPGLEILEDPVEIYSIPHKEVIKSARPAEIEELSEAGLVMKYERNVSVGSFREFVLWQPYEIGAPYITATCNYAELVGSEWKLHFVFFAMKDVLLKAIRNWILENYILSKEKG